MANWLESQTPEIRRIIALLAIVYVLGVMVVYCFYIKSVLSLLKAIKPANRMMRPALVCLLLLGFVDSFTEFYSLLYPMSTALKYLFTYAFIGFVIAWQFYTAGRVATSISAEYRSRGIPMAFAPTYKWAVLYCIALLAQTLVTLLSLGKELLYLTWFLVMLTWIIYWVNIVRYKKAIRNLPAVTDQDSIFFTHNP